MSKKVKLIIAGGLAIVVGFFVVLPNTGSISPSERLTVEITSPSGRTPVTESSIMVTGIVSNTDATVMVDGNEVTLNDDGGFSSEIELEYGTNRITVMAEKEDLRTVNRTLTVPRELQLTIDTPEDNSEYSESRITVAGAVSDTAANVMVAGRDVAIDPETGAWSTQLDLHYPLTVLSVSAQLDGVDPITHLLNINFNAALSSVN